MSGDTRASAGSNFVPQARGQQPAPLGPSGSPYGAAGAVPSGPPVWTGGRHSAARVSTASAEVTGYRAQVTWERRYVRLLILFDAAACVVAAGLAFFVRFGDVVDFDTRPVSSKPYIIMTVLLPLAWVLAMSLNRAYETRFLGGGSEEFRRVVNAAARFTAAVAIVSYATKLEIARSYVLIAFPAATMLSVVGRVVGRGILHRMRRAGRCLHRVLVVGAGESAASLVRLAQRKN